MGIANAKVMGDFVPQSVGDLGLEFSKAVALVFVRALKNDDLVGQGQVV